MKTWIKGGVIGIFLISFIIFSGYSVIAQDLVVPKGEVTTMSKIPIFLKLIGLMLIPIISLIISIFLLKGKLKEKLWLKWGIILEAFLVGQGISTLICSKTLTCQGEWCGIECILPIFPQFIILSLFGIISTIIFSILLYFAIGALIGYLVGKFKVKKK